MIFEGLLRWVQVAHVGAKVVSSDQQRYQLPVVLDVHFGIREHALHQILCHSWNVLAHATGLGGVETEMMIGLNFTLCIIFFSLKKKISYVYCKIVTMLLSLLEKQKIQK